MSEKITFETILDKHADMDATGITLPFDVEEIFGAKRVPVKVRINGAEHRSTIIRMGGKYVLGVPKVFRQATGIKAGEKISVELQKDLAERTVEIPDDLIKVLKENNLLDAFNKMSYTHRKEYVNSIVEAKKEETRIRRIEKACQMISIK